MADPTLKGSSRLLDKHGMPVTIGKLGAGKATAADQANTVRSYLKKNGGFMVIEVHDIPSIALPLTPGEHVERILMFDVGVEGGGLTVKAEQHLHVNAANLQNTWRQDFHLGWRAQWATRGLRKVVAPINLTNAVTPAFMGGEYW